MVTLCGWWVLKKRVKLAIKVSWLSLREPKSDFISVAAAPNCMARLLASRRFGWVNFLVRLVRLVVCSSIGPAIIGICFNWRF